MRKETNRTFEFLNAMIWMTMNSIVKTLCYWTLTKLFRLRCVQEWFKKRSILKYQIIRSNISEVNDHMVEWKSRKSWPYINEDVVKLEKLHFMQGVSDLNCKEWCPQNNHNFQLHVLDSMGSEVLHDLSTSSCGRFNHSFTPFQASGS